MSGSRSRSRSRVGFRLGMALCDFWKAFLEWSTEPFKGCWCYCEDALGTRLDSMGNLHDYDEEDMTWVEYQWLARRNPESPRMRRPPPRLHQHQSPVSIKKKFSSGDDEVDIPPTPPVTPPSNSSPSPAGGAGGGGGGGGRGAEEKRAEEKRAELTRRRSVGVVTKDDIKKLQASFSFPVIEGVPMEATRRRVSFPQLVVVV